MTLHAALLRGVNVGGRTKVAMADLRALCADLGFADVRSLLQSGNLVFRDGRAGSKLETLLETEIAKRLGLKTVVFTRTGAEWSAIVDRNPFPDEAARDPGHLVVMVLKGKAKKAAVEALQARVTGPEVIRAGNRELYITYPAGIGRSRLTIDLIEIEASACPAPAATGTPC